MKLPKNRVGFGVAVTIALIAMIAMTPGCRRKKLADKSEGKAAENSGSKSVSGKPRPNRSQVTKTGDNENNQSTDKTDPEVNEPNKVSAVNAEPKGFVPDLKIEISLPELALPTSLDPQQAVEKFLNERKVVESLKYQQLVIQGGVASVQVLVPEIKARRGDGNTVTKIFITLARIGEPAINPLLEIAEDSAQSVGVRIKALNALGRMRQLAAPAADRIAAIYSQANDARFQELRLESARAIFEIGVMTPQVESAITDMLQNQNLGKPYEYVVIVFDKVRNFGESAAPLIPMLEKYLDSEYLLNRAPKLKESSIKSKQATLVESLGEIGPVAGSSSAKLAELLEKGNSYLSTRIYRSLGLMEETASAAVPSLIQAFRTPKTRDRVKSQIVESLGQIGPASADALPEIKEFLQYCDQKKFQHFKMICQVAIDSISGNPSASVSKMRDALKNGNRDGKTEAAIQIGKIGAAGQPLAAELAQVILDPKSDQKFCWECIKALGNMRQHGADGLGSLISYINREAGNSSTRNYRLSAIESMVKINSDDRVLRGLQHLVANDLDARVRQAARVGLQRLSIQK